MGRLAMTLLVLTFGVFLIFFQGTCGQLLRLKDNKYEGVIVAIGKHVPSTRAIELIQSIKDTFESASRILFDATYQHATFSQVTILIPETWTNVHGTPGYYSYNEAHVRVDEPSPLHGDSPYTQQSRGCGEQGDFIHLTPNYLLDKNTSRTTYGHAGKVFVHEWAHFRYGVFDEYGYQGDAMYPNVYAEEFGKPTLSVCTNAELNIDPKDCKVDPMTGIYKNCNPQILPDQPSITSSLMGIHYLDEVTFFCNASTHQPNAPTKQNLLCQRKSVWEVITEHEDFANFSIKKEAKQPNTIYFKTIRVKRSPIFLVLDESSNMEGNARIEFVQTSLESMMNVVPDDAQFGLITFANDVNENIAKDIDDVINLRRELGLQSKASTAVSEEALIGAIDFAREKLVKNGGGTVLLVTAGVKKNPSNANFLRLCDKLQRDNVRVVSILYPKQVIYDDPIPEYIALLAERTNGRYFIIHDKSQGHNTKLDVLIQLTSATLSVGGQIEPYPEGNYIIHKAATHEGGHISGSIYVEPSFRKTTLLLSFQNSGSYDKHSTKIEQPYNKTDHKTVHNPFKTAKYYTIDNEQSGLLNYSMKILGPNPSVSVVALSYTRNNETITVQTWTNHDFKGINVSEAKPLILYAEVKFRGRPIIDAKVTALIQRPFLPPHTNNFSTVSVDLLDNGNGAPDLIKHDGIYSRYFTKFNARGSYLITVTVENVKATAILDSSVAGTGILPIGSGSSYCCGSKVPIDHVTPTSDFIRIANAGVFRVIEIPNEFNFPPSRINDLRIESYDPVNSKATLMWTAPGADYDDGKAEIYEAKYSENRHLLEDPELFENCPDISHIPLPYPSGETQKLDISHNLNVYEPRVVYYAVRAADQSQKRGEISNIISVQYPAQIPPTTTTLETSQTQVVTSQEIPGDAQTHQMAGWQIGLLAGGILVFLIILITLCMIFWYRRRRKAAENAKTAAMPTRTGETRDANPFRSTNINGGGNVPYNNGNVYTVSDQMSPQFMSASELLEKHAQFKANRERDYLDQGQKPPFVAEDDGYVPRIDEHTIPAGYYSQPPDYYISRHDDIGHNTMGYDTIGHNPFLVGNPNYGRTSLSDKPSSSFTSLSTNEPRKDNGYFTSYEETSEDSNVLRPPGEQPLSASKSSLSRRIVAESQV